MKSFGRVWLSISLIAIGIGTALLVIAAASGAKWRDVSTFSLEESYNGVESVDMDISYGTVKIVKGSAFSISADNLPKDEFKSYVSDGIWHINENNRGHFSLFGIKMSPNNLFGWDGDFTPNITITLPEDFSASKFNIRVGAGYLEAEEISTKEGEFTVGAGELQIDKLTAENKSIYKVGTGHMELKNLSAKNIIVDGGVGDTEIEGIITGDNSIRCGIGHIGIEITGDKKDYSYDVNAGVGEIDIDGDKYHFSNRNIDNDAENSLDLECGIGDIAVDFN